MLAPEGLGGGLRSGVGLYRDWVLMGLVGLLVSTDLSFSKVLFLLVNRRRSRVFLFIINTPATTSRLTRVTRIATVMTTLSAATLMGPLSMLPPKPAFSQKGGAQCASQ